MDDIVTRLRSSDYCDDDSRCDNCALFHAASTRSRGSSPTCTGCAARCDVGTEHGTRTSYVRGCRCDDCRRANRDYAREICRSFDLPVYLITGGRCARLFRIRWALRRITGFRGEARRG